MARSPSDREVKAALKIATERAAEHTRKYGTPCEARMIRASNGEIAIVYDIKHKLTEETVTLHQLPPIYPTQP